jgi:hypothetical protein
VTRPSAFVAELVLVGFALSMAFGPARADAAAPAISIDPVKSASAGDVVLVRFTGWPQGSVAMSVCGNDARRGTQDCAVMYSQALTITSDEPRVAGLTIVVPPEPCPCVIRATTPTNNLVATVPIDIRGAPIGQLIDATGPADPRQLVVHATVQQVDEQFPRSAYGAFGGPTKQVLVLRLHNTGDAKIAGLRVVASVGRSSSSGDPIVARRVAPVAAGETRTIRTPFTLDAPNYGTYSVHGTVFGLAAPLDFAVKTDNDPWALVLLAPIALLVYAQVLRARERRLRRAERAATGGGPPGEFLANTEGSTGSSVTATVDNRDHEIVLDAGVPDAPFIDEPVPDEQPVPVGATGGSLT